MAITMNDIAKVAGVSRATVSLAFRSDARIPATTIKRIRTAATNLGYVYNGAAARLRSGKSRIVGLIVPDLKNPFIVNMLAGMEAACDERDHTVMIASTNELLSRQKRAITAMLEHGVDGILISVARDTVKKDLQALIESNLPVVQVTRRIAGCDLPYVGADNYEAAKIASKHLFQLGHKNIAFIGGHPSSSARVERLAGIQHSYSENQMQFDPTFDFPSDVSMRAGFEMAHAILNQHPSITAAICYNDLVALGVLHGLVHWGKKGGDDFSVIGFDDTDEASLSDPGLSTVGVSPSQIGTVAIQRLFDLVEHIDNSMTVLLPPRMVLRESTSVPNDRKK